MFHNRQLSTAVMYFDNLLLVRWHMATVWAYMAFGLLCIFGASHSFIRWKLNREGVPRNRISTVASTINDFKLYLLNVGEKGWSRWPIVVSVLCISGAASIFLAWLVSWQLAVH